ncbi:DUF262 domain-containing protein [Pedobacter sp. PLR]|uniref:DUF262 domain-containing protein n=1 Tax=Pedobacter sp. PLR TaxID=2994465 RepID=UPI0022467679|nr:DUF262 domain-containing protein [Pedobacter sp. PLR]MCX2454345.1 DUF262 domain-containing protein [Pedobacter sp. PLR]
MDLNNQALSSTPEYSLAELFSTAKRKIIIPDFQRDYCWGDKAHGANGNTDIVSSFLETLIEAFNDDKDNEVLLGKIDVYEHPKEYIHLTDGQQRLTTLYLLIGMLYKITRKEKLRNCLISEFELLHESKSPYLQYAIRESTVFFLQDLVNEFFIAENSLNVSDIVKPNNWYFKEYNLDESVKSMLLSLAVIEGKLNSNIKLSSDEFLDFIIHKVKIQYYDVQDKKHGEERFVIINTTGKSLTVSENAKPILLAGITDEIKQAMFAEQWEDRETWFWKNRSKDENIADNGVNKFLIWCFQIIDKQDEVDLIKKTKDLLKSKESEAYLNRINKLFKALKTLISLLVEERFKKQFQFINAGEVNGLNGLRALAKFNEQNVLLPMLAAIEKFEDDGEGCYLLLRRLRKNIFHKEEHWKDREKRYIDWRYLLQLLEDSKSMNEVLTFSGSFVQFGNIKLPESTWFDLEEQKKAVFVAHRETLEKWEDHKYFMGDLTFLFQTALFEDEAQDILTSIAAFDGEFEVLEKLYSNYESTICLIFKEESAQANVKMANMFRLFRVFIGCNNVGHIYRASYDFEGVLFSSLNRGHLGKRSFMRLIRQEPTQLFSYCENLINQRINDLDIFNPSGFNCEKLIKAWLTLKVYAANEKGLLLPFYDGNGTGVACYTNMDRNRMIKTEPFSLENSLCGFAVKSGGGGSGYVHYTGQNLWSDSEIIDAPFSGMSYDEKDRNAAEIAVNKKEIDRLMEMILIPTV